MCKLRATNRAHAEDLGLFYVRNHDGKLCRWLPDLDQTIPDPSSRCIQPLSQRTINGSAAPGYSSAQATRPSKKSLLKPCRAKWSFDYLAFLPGAKSAQGSPRPRFLSLVAFRVSYPGGLYESWSLPFSVLLGTPIAVFGAFAALWCAEWSTTFSRRSARHADRVGRQKTPFSIVEFARLEYEKGKPLIDAALEGKIRCARF